MNALTASATPVAPPAGHSVAVRRIERVARDTCALTFERPPGFDFEPGQAVDLSLPGAPGEVRAFSLVSAPCEDELTVATRLRDSAFKRGLQRLAVGRRVQVDGPFGALRLHGDPGRPAVFIAGGIGITPFVSMLRQAAHDDRAQCLSLLYANRTPADAAFLPELVRYEAEHRGRFVLRTVFTQGGPGGPGAPRRIDAAAIERVVVPPAAPLFYVVGPPAMVSGVGGVLRGMGIPEDHIRSEDFTGY